jgi:hypothetical protein
MAGQIRNTHGKENGYPKKFGNALIFAIMYEQ